MFVEIELNYKSLRILKTIPSVDSLYSLQLVQIIIICINISYLDNMEHGKLIYFLPKINH